MTIYFWLSRHIYTPKGVSSMVFTTSVGHCLTNRILLTKKIYRLMRVETKTTPPLIFCRNIKKVVFQFFKNPCCTVFLKKVLQISDIDFDYQQIVIRNAKSNKDHVVLLTVNGAAVIS